MHSSLCLTLRVFRPENIMRRLMDLPIRLARGQVAHRNPPQVSKDSADCQHSECILVSKTDERERIEVKLRTTKRQS